MWEGGDGRRKAGRGLAGNGVCADVIRLFSRSHTHAIIHQYSKREDLLSTVIHRSASDHHPRSHTRRKQENMLIPDRHGGELEPVEHKQQLQLDYSGCINKNSTQIIRKTVQEDNSETSGEKEKK